MSSLLTDNASPGSLDGMMPGFLVEEGGMVLVIVAISFILLTGVCYITVRVGRVFFSDLGRKCIISEERFVLELPTSRAMLATARPSCIFFLNDYNTQLSTNYVHNLTWTIEGNIANLELAQMM